jgi:hypothetical protein
VTHGYIYGPGNLPVEQISPTGTVTYLHHDQAGSTRLLTGSTGTVEGAYTYNAYGNTTGHTGAATTSLDYDSQYACGDGLIYKRGSSHYPAPPEPGTPPPDSTPRTRPAPTLLTMTATMVTR